MTKDVIISVSGLQFSEASDESPIELISPGQYFNKGGKHYILYEEVMEGFQEPTKNILKVWDNCLDVTKKGTSNVHMVFEKNKKNDTYYYTPFGSLMIGVDATNIQINEQEDNIDIKVEYGLEMNYEHIADCKIMINVKSKHCENFSLA
jgi:uncharacterized beta-barrel protein YwiB (DUF1934 family)